LSDSLLVGPDRAGRVVAIEGGRVVPEVVGNARHVDASGGVIAPGKINAHTHLYSGLAPMGMPAPEPSPTCFLEILERVWWRLDRALDAESLRASARLYIAEAMLAGTTSLVDHHESPGLIEHSLDILADAYEAFGMRGLVAYGATERNGGRREARAGLAECARFIGERQTDTVRGAVALHASFTVSDETIAEAAALCETLDAVMHVHVAEDAADVADAVERGEAGPLERLERLGAVPPGSVLAHGIHLAEEQVLRAAEAGCWWVHNPRSNEGNRVGYARALDATDRVALGTDGWAADMNEEAAALERLGAAAGADAHRTTRRLDAGHQLIAEQFGVSAAPLTVGALGDLVVEDGQGIRHVVIAGRVVVRDRQLASGDMDTIRLEAERSARELWTRMAAL